MIDVLYVEDNADDADIFSRLVRKFDQSVAYTILNSGSEALEYLSGQGRYQHRTERLPKLLLLDLNLMGMSGIEILEWARSNDRTRFLPIVAFTTSDNPRDVENAYQAGINAYIVKPGSYLATGTLLERLFRFWLMDNTRTDLT
ncbi:response regulator [Larkinella soli]|uniref:response regulator n=1 Tax=Larkinella soli TaxID=1770527 RepID=UPI000FFBDF32|nr:response regulator [Larkinella soli]